MTHKVKLVSASSSTQIGMKIITLRACGGQDSNGAVTTIVPTVSDIIEFEPSPSLFPAFHKPGVSKGAKLK